MEHKWNQNFKKPLWRENEKRQIESDSPENTEKFVISQLFVTQNIPNRRETMFLR